MCLLVLPEGLSRHSPPFSVGLLSSVLSAPLTQKPCAVSMEIGGHCRFSDRFLLPATDGCSNTITGIQKDNLLLVEYALD